MSDLTKEQASLQKQLAAYEGDLSEESKAKIQQIKLQLEKNSKDIEESQYDKFISDSRQLLDDLYLEYETALNQRLDNIDALIADMITEINNDASTINDTLSSKAESVGYELSESMKNIWNSSTNAMLDALAMYDSNVAGGFAEINTSVGEVIRGVTETVMGISNVNTTITSAINSVTGNLQSILDKLTTISTMQSVSAASSYFSGSGGFSSGSSSSSSSGSTSSASGSSGSGFFIYKKDNYAKGSLNINTSIIDRLKYNDFDSSFSARKSYYSAMGLSGTYTGTDAQNAQMINWMKLHGYKNGAYNLRKSELAWTQENGNPEVIIRPSDGAILTPLAEGDSVLNPDATKNLYNFMNSPHDFVRSLGLNNIPVHTQKAQNINIGGVEFVINAPNATNWAEIKQDAMKDTQFTRFMQEVTVGKATGRSTLRKYNV